MYVGSSKHVQTRIDQHQLGAGAEWTKMYPPVGTLSRLTSVEGLEGELLEVLAQMSVWGVDNVRGGPFTQPGEFNANDRQMVLRLKRYMCNTCQNCGQAHYSTSCPC